MRLPNRGACRAFVFAVLAVALAALLRTAVQVRFGHALSYTAMSLAVIAATMFGRYRGGIFATGLALLVVESDAGRPADLVELRNVWEPLCFTAASLAFLGLYETLLRSQWQAEAVADKRSQLLASEHVALTEAERASSQSERLVALVAHELRVPVEAIASWAQVLTCDDPDETHRRIGLATVSQNASLLLRLIDDLAAGTHASDGRVRLRISLLDPSQAVEAAIRSLLPAAEAKSICIESVARGNIHPIHADRERLQQIVANLMANAIRFSDGGTRIRVVLSQCGGETQVRVIDQGHGIDPALVHLLFQPCLGVGGAHSSPCAVARMGLWIVKQLVELHGGAVTVESAGLGRGTTVTVRIPTRTRIAVAAEKAPKPPTLLVVDPAEPQIAPAEAWSLQSPVAEYQTSEPPVQSNGAQAVVVTAGKDET